MGIKMEGLRWWEDELFILNVNLVGDYYCPRHSSQASKKYMIIIVYIPIIVNTKLILQNTQAPECKIIPHIP